MYKTENDFVDGQRTKVVLIIIGLLLILLTSCNSGIEYQYGVENQVPDSLKNKYAELVVKITSAASYHLNAGDYEDPEDVIAQAQTTAEKILSVKVEGLFLLRNQTWHFLPKDQLDNDQLEIFYSLKASRK